jgi:imidazolonepropionase-like amidohydrolase
MVHCNGARTLEATAMAKADSIEHGAYGDEDSLAAMAENGVIWVPTVSTVANLRGKGRHDEAAVEAIFQSFGENLQRFVAMGGVIASGSDAGAWQVTHGCDTEDGLLTSFGIDPTPGNLAIQAKF